MLDIDESAVDITFNPTSESTFAAPKEIDETAGFGCGQSFDESMSNDVTVMDKTAPISEDDTEGESQCRFYKIPNLLKSRKKRKTKQTKRMASPLARA